MLLMQYMPSGIDDITIIFKKEDLNTKLIDQICNEVQLSLNPDQIKCSGLLIMPLQW